MEKSCPLIDSSLVTIFVTTGNHDIAAFFYTIALAVSYTLRIILYQKGREINLDGKTVLDNFRVYLPLVHIGNLQMLKI